MSPLWNEAREEGVRLMMRFAPLAFLLMTAACGSTPAPQPQPAGAYSDTDTDSADVIGSAERAVTLLRTRVGDESLKLQKIDRAETQVVAGKNTRLRLSIESDGGTKTVTVVVFRSLQGEERLTEVEGL